MGTLTQNGCQRWKTKRSQSRFTLDDSEQSAWANEVTLPGGLGSGGSMDDALSGAVLSKDLGFSFRAPELKLLHPKPHGWLGLATAKLLKRNVRGGSLGVGNNGSSVHRSFCSIGQPPTLPEAKAVCCLLFTTKMVQTPRVVQVHELGKRVYDLKGRAQVRKATPGQAGDWENVGQGTDWELPHGASNREPFRDSPSI